MDIPRDNLFLFLSLSFVEEEEKLIFFSNYIYLYTLQHVLNARRTREGERKREERGTKFMYRLVCNEVNRGRNLH